MFSERLLPVALCLSLGACGALPPGSGGGSGGFSGEGSNREALAERLAAEPMVCTEHRRLYVEGFKANVKALSESDELLRARAQTLLGESRELLLAEGLTQDDCARPYCIIEPLQGGQLDSWCGYRISADQGDELYQWLNWSDTQ